MFLVSLRMHIFRVSQQDEIAGLDEVKHKEKAYEFGEWKELRSGLKNYKSWKYSILPFIYR